MPELALAHPSRRALLVLALTSLVHWPATDLSAQSAKRQTPPAKSGKAGRADPQKLPPQVAEMRDAILAAVRSGEIEDLRYAIDFNELRPEIGAANGSDPITHLRTISGDGQGREILAVLGEILEMPFAAVPAGRDIENNLVYVWPYIAEIPPANLTPGQQVELLRLVGAAEAKTMRETNRWTSWRLAIGADGTWHAFLKTP